MTTVNGSESGYVGYLNIPRPSWTRPEGPARIWRVVEGRKKTAGGETLRFSIQEVLKELESDVVDFMEKYYTVEGPLCASQGTANNPLAVCELRTLWRDLLHQGVSVVALTLDADPVAKPVIAGVNLLIVSTAEEKSNNKSENAMQFRVEANKQRTRMSRELSQEVDAMKKYGVDKCLRGRGLIVPPYFRGQGLGQEIIRAREDIGLAYQIPMSETAFTSLASQILAAHAGYEVLLERNYSELLDDEGKVIFPGMTSKSIKVMARRFY